MESKKHADFPYGISEKMIYSRALQSVVWGIPAVNYDLMYQAFLSVGGSYNQIAYSARPGHWKNQLLTPNADAVFVLPFFNTGISGPMVLEIPKTAEFSIVGTILSCWHLPLEDVGQHGADQGNGANYLILPPDYKDTVPSQYTVLPAPNYQGYALLRCIPKSDKHIDFARAILYMEQIKLYPLSGVEASLPTTYVDITDKDFDAAIKYDITFLESLNRIVQEEPWLERDMLMVDILKSAGIEKGKKFSPDIKMRQILTEAITDGKEFLEQQYQSYMRFYENSRWFFPSNSALLNSSMSGFKEKESYPIDARATANYWGFGSLKRTDAAISQFYLFLIHDHDGNNLSGNKAYQLVIPPDIPASKYWSVTVYNRNTHTYIKNVPYASRSSLNQDLKINEDGTITLYFAPSSPLGQQSNWMPTRQNEDFELIFRFYGVENKLLEKKWTLPDLSIIKGWN